MRVDEEEPVTDHVGVVAALRRFPVKSMLGELVDTASLAASGVQGDRAFAVVDTRSGQVVGAKTPDLGPRVLACRAAFVTAPAPGEDLPPVVVELPDGTCARTDADDVDRVLSSYLGAPVTLVSQAPPRSALVDVRRDWLDRLGLGRHFAEGALLDLLPVSVLTTSTLRRLRSARPESDFDERRFRMNVVVETEPEGFLENTWPGRALRIGTSTGLRVAFPVPRCALTTMAQEDLPKDLAVLRTVARENSVELGERAYPCVGAYATVEEVGEVRSGDTVRLL
jgi:uncharacterized protein